MNVTQPKPVAIVVPQNAQSLDVSGPLDAFLEANRQAPGRSSYEIRLLSTGPDRSAKAGGMSLIANGSIFADEGVIDTLLVAGTPDYAQAYTSTDLHSHGCESAPNVDPFRRRMLTLPYRPIIVSAECLSNQAPGSLLEADWRVKRHADSHAAPCRSAVALPGGATSNPSSSESRPCASARPSRAG